VVEVGAPLAPPGLDALRHQRDDLVELVAGQVVVGGRPPDQLVEVVAGPLLGRDLGHHLLGGDVEREVGQLDGVEPAALHGGEERRALDQLVAGERVEDALGGARPGVVGPAHPLQERGDAAGRGDLAHQLDGPDVDAQLQRRRGHQGLEVAGPQPGLHPEAALLGQAAVVGGHHVVAQALTQLVGEAFGEPPGVDEDERGAVLAHVGRDRVEHAGHLLGRGDRLELAVGQLQRQVERPLVADVDDPGQWPVAHEQPAHRLDRALGGRQPDPGGPRRADGLQPFQADRQVGAALVARHRVDLVDDDGVDGAQGIAPSLAGEQQVERLGRGDHEARGLAHHLGALPARGVAGADADPDVGWREAQLAGDLGDLGQRPFQVLGDVDRQGLQRRHVHRARPLRHVVALGVGLVEPVDGHQEAGQRLARTGGRRDQRVVTCGDEGPARRLRWGGALREAPQEPLGDRRVEGAEDRVLGGRGLLRCTHGTQSEGGV
jgi:hypothetical protein